MDLRKKWSRKRCDSLQALLKTLDRFGLMPAYVVTAEMKPTSYLNKFSNIEYEGPGTVYGVVIRIMTNEGVVMRISIDEEETE